MRIAEIEALMVPGAVTLPERRGFGSQIIERVLAAEFAGQVTLDYRAGGLFCTLAAPLYA